VFSLSLDLDAGVSIRDLESPSHSVTIDRLRDDRARVSILRSQGASLTRDFRLRWRVGGRIPEVGVLAWRDPATGKVPAGGGWPLIAPEVVDHGVFTLIVQPPLDVDEEDSTPRELVFVLDCSGSMRGVPLDAAKGVVRKALGAVRPADTFQIIRFSESASGLGPEPLPPTAENLRRAHAYLDSLYGSGGTEMIAGIRAALDYPPDPRRLRIVAFLTDGYIGNEREILAEVRRKLGDARLFSFGIGSSVNRYLLESLAEEGRGAAAFLGPREKPDEMVDRFVRRIATPVLTDIRIRWQDLQVGDLEPGLTPDLFAGQPLVIHGRYRTPGTGIAVVEGRHNGRPVSFREVVTLPARATDHEALGRLWARARIHRLHRELHDGDRADLREKIIALGLRHRLMTRWTSLVAVDSEISNRTGSATELTVPVELPEDVSYEGIFGKKSAAHSATGMNRALAPVGLMGNAGLRSRGSAGLDEAEEALPPPAARQEAHRRRLEPGSKPAPELRKDERAFSTLTLVREDGTRFVFESDGEVWMVGARERTLLRILPAGDLQAIREALAAARPQSWVENRSATSRLTVEAPGLRGTVSLPSVDAAVTGLVRLLESWLGP
jgi:Ca-activated chloride channel family protein